MKRRAVFFLPAKCRFETRGSSFPLPLQVFVKGDTVRVAGLQKAPELNGETAMVLERRESDRYMVRVAEREVSIAAKNLRPVGVWFAEPEISGVRSISVESIERFAHLA